MQVKEASLQQLNAIVDLHMTTFSGFFLTFLGPGFLKRLYRAFLMHENSELLIAENDNDELVGFVAYSNNLSALYRHLLRSSLISLAWYSFLALLRRPSVIARLLRGLSQPRQSERAERYAVLSSIAVSTRKQKTGVGSMLIEEVKGRIDFSAISYLKLETDADNNTDVNAFYLRNGFALHHAYTTPEGRKMNEYRFTPLQTEKANP